jgi:hypothetical protein
MRISVLLALAAMASPVAAQWSGWDYVRDEPVRSWNEGETKLPPFPRESDLLQFDAGGASPHRFFVDPGSIAPGEDGVVRYTLVVKAAGGATNVSFEGIRCETRELRIYATGRDDGSWSAARDPRWRRIAAGDVNRHHGVLHGGVLCRGRVPVASAGEAVKAVRQGPPAMP